MNTLYRGSGLLLYFMTHYFAWQIQSASITNLQAHICTGRLFSLPLISKQYRANNLPSIYIVLAITKYFRGNFKHLGGYMKVLCKHHTKLSKGLEYL